MILKRNNKNEVTLNNFEWVISLASQKRLTQTCLKKNESDDFYFFGNISGI